MNALLKVSLILATAFATTFLIFKQSGLLSIESIEQLLTQATSLSPWSVAAIVVALLLADLFIAVPTLTITLLSGFFLGPLYGFVAALIGYLLAGTCGYAISHKYGDKLFKLLIKDPDESTNACRTFQAHGFVTILLSRALPILPEVSACLAGITKMPFPKFLLAWLLSTTPYALIASYAGSISTIDDPMPAIYTAIGLTTFFWVSWFLFSRKIRNVVNVTAGADQRF